MLPNGVMWLFEWKYQLLDFPITLKRDFIYGNNYYMLECRWEWKDPWAFYLYSGEEFIAPLGWGRTEKDSFIDVCKYAESLLALYLLKEKE